MSQHWNISRREFLVGAGVLLGAAAAGGTLWGLDSGGSPRAAPSLAPAGGGAGTGPLVVVSLYGGNDGLNTVVPYTDPTYASVRPTLGYSAKQVLDLDGQLGLNPQLTGFQSLWKAGKLAIVRGVGYPNPNLSHFASMDIWQTANPTDGSGPGWLGRWLDATGVDPMRAISVGATLPVLLRGEKSSATAVVGPQITLPGSGTFQEAYHGMQKAGPDRVGQSAAVAAAGTALLDVQAQLDSLKAEVTPTGTGSGVTSSDLAGQLAIVAALINAGAPTKVYQVSLSSFDTHSDEKPNQEKLLGELDKAVSVFLDAIATSPIGRNAVLMTYSEFGRRPAQNASGGTDHGTAAPLFIAGHTVRGGQFYGEEPSLNQLDANGNLVYNVDFRSVYATVLERVVGFDSKEVLGATYRTLTFV